MKKIISAAAAAALMLSLQCPSYAEDAVTAKQVQALITDGNLLSSKHLEDVKNHTFTDPLNVTVKGKLGSIINHADSVRVYNCDIDDLYIKYPDLNLITGYDDAIEKVKSLYPEDSESYIAPDPNDKEYSYSIDIFDGSLSAHRYKGMTDSKLTLDPERIAKAINGGGLTSPTRIRALHSGQVLVDTADGQYIINVEDEYTFDEKTLVFKADVPVPAKENWDFRVTRYLESLNQKNTVPDGENASATGFEPGDNISRFKDTPSGYKDIENGTLLCASVNMLTDLGAVTGYEDGTFRAENAVTRAEAAAMLSRLCRYEPEQPQFDDTANHWAKDYIGALSSKGIINGSNNLFMPDSNITYEQLFKITLSILGRYGDYESRNYPHSAVEAAMSAGLTKNIGAFLTADPVTRGDMAIIIGTALDTNIRTYVCHSVSQTGVAMIGINDDITLYDYIGGGELHANYFTSPEAYNDWYSGLTK